MRKYNSNEMENTIAAFENQNMKMWIKEDILYCLYVPFLTITLDIAQDCIHERIKFTEGKTYPLFSDIHKIRYIDRASRIYLSEESSLTNISAESILISSQSDKISSNLYLKIHKPCIPTKQFSSKEEAIQWLHQFKGLKN